MHRRQKGFRSSPCNILWLAGHKMDHAAAGVDRETHTKKRCIIPHNPSRSLYTFPCFPEEKNHGIVASKDDNWAGKYILDLRSKTTQQRLTDPRHKLADCYYHRTRVLITQKLADFSHNKIRLLYRSGPLHSTVLVFSRYVQNIM
jgi:hypothetical protein